MPEQNLKRDMKAKMKKPMEGFEPPTRSLRRNGSSSISNLLIYSQVPRLKTMLFDIKNGSNFRALLDERTARSHHTRCCAHVTSGYAKISW